MGRTLATVRKTSSSGSTSNARTPRGTKFTKAVALKKATRAVCLDLFEAAFGFEWDPSVLSSTSPRRTEGEAERLLHELRLAVRRVELFVERRAARTAARMAVRVGGRGRAAALDDPDESPTARFLPDLVKGLRRIEALRRAAEDAEPREPRVLLARELVRLEVSASPSRDGSGGLNLHPLGKAPSVAESAIISILSGSWPAIGPTSLSGNGLTVKQVIALEERAVRQAMLRARKLQRERAARLRIAQGL